MSFKKEEGALKIRLNTPALAGCYCFESIYFDIRCSELNPSLPRLKRRGEPPYTESEGKTLVHRMLGKTDSPAKAGLSVRNPDLMSYPYFIFFNNSCQVPRIG